MYKLTVDINAQSHYMFIHYEIVVMVRVMVNINQGKLFLVAKLLYNQLFMSVRDAMEKMIFSQLLFKIGG